MRMLCVLCGSALCLLALLTGCGKEDQPGNPSGGGGAAAGGTTGGGTAGGDAAGGGSGITCLDDYTVQEANGNSYGCFGNFCVPGYGCGMRCLDDHTEQQVGKTWDCTPYYCIAGEGCGATCQKNEDCRPGYECVLGIGKCGFPPMDL